MKMPDRREGPLGYDENVDHLALRFTIRDWRNGLDPFGRLGEGKDVPAKVVAAHARKVEASIHETSRFAAEKPKLIAVAEFAERLANLEKAKAAMSKAAALYKAAGFRYRDWYEDAISVQDWSDE